ncbi:MAG: 4-diphosphocytidyl-2C-methyl-D-erythritol kinase, partial [Ramlibacter sp.]|nr:4-diphosphocytidyl-2C-methyl-D-erythritol kinase [Ramlibacter sp.]
VPFFLRGRNAWVEGVGERIRPLDLPAARFVVAKPPQGLDTARIFGDEQLKRDSAPAIISGFAADPHGGFPYGFGHNDLQPVAQRLCPAVTQALQWLGEQGLEARMTGSGSAVFAQMTQEKHLLPAPAGWQVRECGNMAVHPLVGWAASDDFGGGPVS